MGSTVPSGLNNPTRNRALVGWPRNARGAGDPAPRGFWRHEYRLNARIARYPKPIVAIMDGIVMGGGVGISAHATLRVVTERTAVAMPEVGIGFAPDVGSTWLLAQAPGELGTHVALTGTRLGDGPQPEERAAAEASGANCTCR